MQFSTSLICLVRNFKAFLMEKFPQDLDFQNVKKIMNRWSVINMRSFTQINVNREKSFTCVAVSDGTEIFSNFNKNLK